MTLRDEESGKLFQVNQGVLTEIHHRQPQATGSGTEADQEDQYLEYEKQYSVHEVN